MPPTTPEEDPTVPIAVLLLDHVPPETALDKVVVAPAHTDSVPVVAPTVGVVFTVTL
jgi:hypothetical protein